MSLIADALKRAQEQRAGESREDRARRMLASPVQGRVRSGRSRVERPVLAAGLALVLAVALLGGAVLGAPRPDGEPLRASIAAEAPRPTGEGAPPAADSGEEPAAAEAGMVRLGEVAVAGVPAGAGVEPARSAAAPEPEPARAAPDRGGAARPDAAGAAAGAGAADPTRFRLTVEREGGDHMALGLAAQQRGDHAVAATWYERALVHRPDDPQLHNNLGTVYRALSQPVRAESAFRAAVSVAPAYAPAWSNLGMVLESMGRNEEAVAAFRAALAANPSNVGARVNLANQYQGMGLLDEARGLLSSVLRDDPSLPEAHYGMARLMEIQGDAAGAIRHYRLFLNLGRGAFPALEGRVIERVRVLEDGS